MNYFAYAGLLITASCLLVIIIMLITGRSKLHFLCSFFCISVALWGFGDFKIGTSIDSDTALWWWRVAYVGVIFIPVSHYHFVHEFLKFSRKRLLYVFYLITIFFFVLDVFTDKFINQVTFKFDQLYYLNPPTLIYSVFVFFFVALVFYGHFLLYKEYRIEKGLRRSQIRYFFLATAIGFTGGMTAFLPVYNIDLYPWANIAIFLYPLILTYAIAKYRLLGIKEAIQKLVIYFLVLGFLSVLYFSLCFVFEKYALLGCRENSLVSAFIALSLSWLLAPRFVVILHKLSDKFFLNEAYDYPEAVKKISESINFGLDLDKILNSSLSVIKDTLKIDKIIFLVYSSETKKYEVKKNIGNVDAKIISLRETSSLARYLYKKRDVVILEEVGLKLEINSALEEEGISLQKVHKELEKLGIFLCHPIIKNDKLTAIVCLGSKDSGDIFQENDFRLVDTFANQMAIAIDNFLAYQEIKAKKEQLEKSMKLMVGRELEMINMKKELSQLKKTSL